MSDEEPASFELRSVGAAGFQRAFDLLLGQTARVLPRANVFPGAGTSTLLWRPEDTPFAEHSRPPPPGEDAENIDLTLLTLACVLAVELRVAAPREAACT